MYKRQEFSDEIFIYQDNNTLSNKISTDNMKRMGEIITIRIFSDEKGCEMNINAHLSYKKNHIFMQTLIFMAFVLFLGKLY